MLRCVTYLPISGEERIANYQIRSRYGGLKAMKGLDLGKMAEISVGENCRAMFPAACCEAGN